MGAIGDIWVNIGMKSTFDRDSTKVKGAMSRLSGTVKQHGLMIGGAMTGIGAAMLLAGKQVDTAYADIIAGTGATGDALDDLKDSFHDVYGTIPADAKTVGNALATINTLTGATGDTLEDLTVNIAEVSRMLGEDATQNAESFGQAMTQWQVPAEKGTALMDKLFKICQDTNIGFGDLTTQLNKYGSVMLNAGYTIEETAQMMGRLHASGMQVSRIMPGLNAAFRKWAKAGKDAKTELELTVTAIADAETSMDALAIATDTFGAEGAQRLVTAIRNNTFALDDLDTGLDDTKGLIASTAKETLTLSDKLATLKNKFTGILAPLQPLGAVMAGLGPTLMAVSMAMSMSAASAGAGTISYAQFAIAELGVAGATKVLTLALLTNPLFMGIAIGAAVIAGLYILERKFGSLTRIGKLLGTAMDNLAEYLTKVGTALNTTVVPAITNTYQKVQDLSTTIKAKLAPSFERLNFVTKYWKDELVLLGGPLGLVSYEVLKLGDAFNFLTGEGDKTGDSFDDLMGTLGDLGDSSEETMARITAAMGTISPAIADYEKAVRDAKDAQDDLSEAVRETADLKGDVDDLTSAYTDLKGAIDDILGVEDDLDDQTRDITRAQKKLNDAQKSYNTLLKGAASGSKAAINAEVDLADARERHARILEDEESSTAEIAKANYDLADAEEEYADIIHGVAKDSEKAVESELDLADARDALEDKTAKLIGTIKAVGTADEQITRILKDNGIELSQSLKDRLASEKTARSKATNDIVTNLGIEKKTHESAYRGILTEVNTILQNKTS
ncbi:MAG: phage tail tape measure protein, partial [Methanosarcinales archaeon]